MGNNYTGELVGIQIALEFLNEIIDTSNISGRNIHIFTDCQAAILTAFNNHVPKNKIEIILKIKESISQLSSRDNHIQVHWVPGHKGIEGNELADRQAKDGALEMKDPDCQVPVILDKKEAVREMKKHMKEKWSRKYKFSEKVEQVQEVFADVGSRCCYGEGDRQTFSALNQLLTGHSILNNHRAKIDPNISKMCSICQVPEDTQHYLFTCEAYKNERGILEKTVEDILHRQGLNTISDIDLKVLNGEIEDINKETQNELIGALLEYIRCTKRFS